MNARACLALVGWLLMSATATATQTQLIDWASPIQQEAFNYGPFPQCASGGFGSGKTFAYSLKALWLSDTFPKNRGVICRRVAKELKATTMATFYKVCPASAYKYGRRNDQEGRLVLNNGSEILFLHFENPETQAMLRGLEINWFFIDQAEEQPEVLEEVFDVLMARIGRWDVAEVPDWMIAQEKAAGRSWAFVNPTTGKPQPPPYAMLAVNPDIELHWVYRRFHPESAEHYEKKLPELNTATGQPTGKLVSYRDLGYRLFHMPSLENKFLPETNRQALLAHDEAFVKRYVRGEWGLPEGAIHVIPPESLIQGTPELLDYFRSSCTLYRTLDHGDSSPTACVWWAVDREANVFAFREYYLPNALVSTHRANITALSEYERYSQNLADPSIFHRLHQKHGGRWATADEYSDTREHDPKTAIQWMPADNNELGTRNRINEYLRVDPTRTHPITREKGSPRLFFVQASDAYPQGCTHVIRETRAQRRVKIGSEMGRPVFSDERDDTVPDHAYDTLRYLIASRPALPSLVKPQASIKTFDGLARYAAKYAKSQQKVR
jgi:hypothetical protein